MPGTPDKQPAETVLAFDFGLRRIGIAVGQQITCSASPLGTVANGARGPDWPRIDAFVRDWQPARLLVGLPTRADGSPSSLQQPLLAFREALARYALPVHSVDERDSSLEGSERLLAARRAGRRRRIARSDIDAAAAVTIAERWLRREAGQLPGKTE